MLGRLRRRLEDGLERYFRNVEANCEADENCRRMRAALNEVAQEYEAMSYEALLQPPEVLSSSRVFDGVLLHFSAEVLGVEENGDIRVNIDVRGLRSRSRWEPSYVFVKRRDGTVLPPGA